MSIPGQMARNGTTLSPCLKAPDVCPNRSDHCSTHHQSPRNDRRYTQLGLSLYLATRCGLLALQSAYPRSDTGSRSIYGLARRPLPRVTEEWHPPTDVWD